MGKSTIGDKRSHIEFRQLWRLWCQDEQLMWGWARVEQRGRDRKAWTRETREKRKRKEREEWKKGEVLGCTYLAGVPSLLNCIHLLEVNSGRRMCGLAENLVLCTLQFNHLVESLKNDCNSHWILKQHQCGKILAPWNSPSVMMYI